MGRLRIVVAREDWLRGWLGRSLVLGPRHVVAPLLNQVVV